MTEIGLKLWSTNISYIQTASQLYQKNIFDYVELYVVPDSKNECLNHWRACSIPFIVHAPHSYSGLNLSLRDYEQSNRVFVEEVESFRRALGNGYPMAAVIGKSEVMETAQMTFISSTYWTERIGPTAALATLKKHQRLNAGSHLMEIGQLVQEGWKNIAAKNNLEIEIGGIPPLSHFTFEHEQAFSLKALFIQIMLEKGFLASTLFYAMYAHEKYHVENYIIAVDEAMAQLHIAINRGDIEKQLQGKPAGSGFKRFA
jgi:hypothetical protein